MCNKIARYCVVTTGVLLTVDSQSLRSDYTNTQVSLNMLWFLMTDSICHSSLPRTVLEKVTLTTIQFRIHPRTKVDTMFQCVYISTPLKSCPYKVVQLVLDLWRESLRKPALIYMRTTKAPISLRVRAGWSAPLLFAVARFFSTKKRLTN